MRLVLDFFFQAEDGIRDLTVTGVQTCALPILRTIDDIARLTPGITFTRADGRNAGAANIAIRGIASNVATSTTGIYIDRSEERRVGKSVDLGGRRIITKKNDTVQSNQHMLVLA